MIRARLQNPTRALLVSALATLAVAAATSPASAAISRPIWKINSVSNSTAEPGGQHSFFVDARNIGVAPPEGEVSLTVVLPPGLSLLSAGPYGSLLAPGLQCPTASPGDTAFACSGFASDGGISNRIVVAVAPDATGVKTARFQVEGGGALEPAATADPVRISDAAPSFGIDAFDTQFTADAAGDAFSQAAGHPYASLGNIDIELATEAAAAGGDHIPVEPVRDIDVDLPPGLLGYPAAADACTLADLANVETLSVNARPLCSPESQVGAVDIVFNGGHDLLSFPNLAAVVPVFNVVPPPGVPARFGFNASGTLVVLDARVRSGSDYGVTLVSENIGEGLPILGSHLALWGFPASPEHEVERACPGQDRPDASGSFCDSLAPEIAFLRLPTSCSAPGVGLPVSARADSWLNPGVFDSRSIETHDTPGFPYPEEEWGPPLGTTGCDRVPFDPGLSVQTTTEAADSPTGLDIGLTLPQRGDHGIDQSDLRDAAITLPPGMTINPSAAGGQGACTTVQIGLLGTDFPAPAPIHFTPDPPSCPDDSKIGTVEIVTPALDHPIEGAVYLAKQGDNPFGSLLALYIVGDDSAHGVVVKLAGEVEADPQTGRLTTRIENSPQTPFDSVHVRLFGGPRAALRTPPSCGTFGVRGTFTPWSGNAPVAVGAAFDITKGCGAGFDPELSAGTSNPVAGQTSPFSLRLTRGDGEEELASLTLHEPAGLSGYLAGIPYCPDAALAAVSGDLGTGGAQESTPACPAASQVGTVTVGAGAGVNPFYTQAGRAYLAGPYNGAPLSVAVVTPAVAGPFDLGSVVVRNAVRVDPVTAQLTVQSDPLPTILHGIPLDLRDVRVDLDRGHFVLNPTSCEEMQFTSRISSVQGAVAEPSERFQVAGCDKLGFKPRLALKLSGGTKRSKHPGLTAVMRPREGNANASRIQVALPHSEFLAQGHIRTICTRVQFAADQCPAGSVYGHVTATTPILDQPLSGDVYLRSSDNPLPDMVLKLRGPAWQPIEIDAVGRIDSKNGGLRTTFATVPDAPLTKVVVELPAGKKSLLENSTDICRGEHRATVAMDAHNGFVQKTRPKLQVAGCVGKKRGGKRRG